MMWPKSILEMATATPSQRNACREVLAAFGREIPPELQPTPEEAADERPRCFSVAEAAALLADLEEATQIPTDGELGETLQEVLCSFPRTNGNAFEVFGITYDDQILARTTECAGSRAAPGIARQITRLVGLARETGGDMRFRPWCNAESFFREFDMIDVIPEGSRTDNDRERLKFLKQVSNSGLMRRKSMPADPASLLGLVEQFPNFSAPISFFAEQAALARLRGDKGGNLIPVLLVGPHGVGKTHFARSLAEAMDSRIESLDMATQSSGFALAGLDRGWSSARPGLVCQSLQSGKSLAPIILVDELDKPNSDSRSDPLGPLYALLEPRSARVFRDEYADFPIDASHIVWIATANETRTIPAPLLSRFKVFEIEAPDDDQLPQIAEQMFRKSMAGIPGAQPAMPPGWKVRLRGKSPRDIRLAIDQALGRAALRASTNNALCIDVVEEDLLVAELLGHRRIGF